MRGVQAEHEIPYPMAQEAYRSVYRLERTRLSCPVYSRTDIISECKGDTFCSVYTGPIGNAVHIYMRLGRRPNLTLDVALDESG